MTNFVRHRWVRRPEKDARGMLAYRCESECGMWIFIPQPTPAPVHMPTLCWVPGLGQRLTPGDREGTVICVDFRDRIVHLGFGDTLEAQSASAIPLTFDDCERLLKQEATAVAVRM